MEKENTKQRIERERLQVKTYFFLLTSQEKTSHIGFTFGDKPNDSVPNYEDDKNPTSAGIRFKAAIALSTKETDKKIKEYKKMFGQNISYTFK